jgi:arsenite methyltransferase
MQEQMIKEKLKERYGKIALTANSDGCCAPTDNCSSHEMISSVQMAEKIGYDAKELESVPQSSILGVGCGAPVNFADIKEGEVVVDIGSGGGIDVFLSANKVKDSGKVIGIDMTDEMLEKARNNAKGAYTNVEFRKGDIENRIPVEDSTVDVAVSNCVINLTTDKVSTFKEIHRILKNGGRMIISDLVTDREVDKNLVNVEKWCSCIDGALTKEKQDSKVFRCYKKHNIWKIRQMVE